MQITLTPLSLLGVLVGAGLLSGAAITSSDHLIGKAPTKKQAFAGHGMVEESQPSLPEDEETKKLRAEVEKDPSNIEAKKNLVTKLWDNLAEAEYAPLNGMFDIIDLLGQILEAEPNDKTALIMMANLSFNQKIFEKSALYYKRYLTVVPDDFEARSSYASSLTFLGKFDEAIKELDTVTKKNPNYFQALAYKTIALAQMGKTDEALKLGKVALAKAPSDEARDRFAQFVNSIAPANEDAVTGFVKNHQVTGPKYVRSDKKEDGTLNIYMKDFPMDQMPPTMKDSYTAKVKAAAKSDPTIKTVFFIDENSKAVLATITTE